MLSPDFTSGGFSGTPTKRTAGYTIVNDMTVPHESIFFNKQKNFKRR